MGGILRSAAKLRNHLLIADGKFLTVNLLRTRMLPTSILEWEGERSGYHSSSTFPLGKRLSGTIALPVDDTRTQPIKKLSKLNLASKRLTSCGSLSHSRAQLNAKKKKQIKTKTKTGCLQISKLGSITKPSVVRERGTYLLDHLWSVCCDCRDQLSNKTHRRASH